ncbi:MAG TPA: cation:proton antiporter, partial [Verrucomicrobiota bacterium]|nr:cation:proton antiporter [Verrucomicrobiota bacterium]
MDAGILFVKDLAVVMVVAGVVGRVFQRLGLSVVVGYLLAGILIGPRTLPYQLVEDTERIQILSQVGLVFLIFSIGLGLSFARIQRLGLSVIGATIIGAILVLNICRLFGLMMGWSATQSLFLAGMLMVSSSAIISKVLEELNVAHHRSSQMALGITVLEDVVAIIMLTLLTSLVRVDAAEGATLWKTLGTLSAFVVFLVFMALLILPRLLRYLSRHSTLELRTIVVAACVLLVGYVGVRAGFSAALGAFILGVIIAGTRFRDEIERTFESLRSIFGAVFFVAIGMMLDVKLLANNWWLVLLTTALVLVARPLATSMGLVAMGNSVREAVRAGLSLTPIGEFSFVIAQLGVMSGAVPDSMYAVAVGLSLTTAVIAPVLTRHSESMSHWVERHEPRVIRNWTEFYHDWLEGLAGRRNASLLWQLTSKRILQTALQILFASAMVLFANPVYQWLLRRVGPDWLVPNGTIIVFWTVFGVVFLAPLIAIWRNIDALVMILVEGATRTNPRRARLRPLIQTAIKTVVAVVMSVWLLVLLPFGPSLLWALGIVAGILAFLGAVFWRR